MEKIKKCILCEKPIDNPEATLHMKNHFDDKYRYICESCESTIIEISCLANGETLSALTTELINRMNKVRSDAQTNIYDKATTCDEELKALDYIKDKAISYLRLQGYLMKNKNLEDRFGGEETEIKEKIEKLEIPLLSNDNFFDIIYAFLLDLHNTGMSYWMKSGNKKLKEAVRKYFAVDDLTKEEIIILRNYIKDYVSGLPFIVPAADRLIEDLGKITTENGLKQAISTLLDYGIDPF